MQIFGFFLLTKKVPELKRSAIVEGLQVALETDFVAVPERDHQFQRIGQQHLCESAS